MIDIAMLLHRSPYIIFSLSLSPSLSPLFRSPTSTPSLSDPISLPPWQEGRDIGSLAGSQTC